VGVAHDDTGVAVALSEGQSLRAEYLVGCDGGRSLVRKAAGLDFVGLDPSTSWMIAEVEMDEPDLGMRREGGGIGPVNRAEGGGPFRVVLTEGHSAHTSEPTLEDLSEALISAYGTDFGVRSPTWISRFTDMSRQAASYRHGRVLLAGDAPHVHPPQGGQGLNTGVQDAVNLGWKLAQVVNKTSPESLLDTYHAERHPVAARVLRNTMAQVALSSPDDRHQALRDTMSELLSMDERRKRFAAMLSGLDIHDDLGEGHPLLGRRMPDLDLVTANGPLRVVTLLHAARPVLLTLGEPGGVVTEDALVFERTSRSPMRAAFSCGNEYLDRYIRTQARQDQEKRAVGVYVLRHTPTDRIAGYYTLTASSIETQDLPEDVARSLPRYEVQGAILIGYLARDFQFRGAGIGEMLLRDALQRGLEMQQSGLRAVAVVVDAIDDAAATFYESYGLKPLTRNPMRLFMALETVAILPRSGE